MVSSTASTGLVSRLLGAATAAVAVVLIAFAGVYLAAAGASPGEWMWPAARVLHPDWAQVVEDSQRSAQADRHSVQASYAVRDALVGAKAALSDGDPARARRALASAQRQLPQVSDTQDRAAAQTLCAQLAAALGDATTADGRR